MIFGGIILFVIFLIVGLSLFNKENNNMNNGNDGVLKLIYLILIGIFVAVFVGVGIAAFYPEPKYPEAPNSMKYGYTEPEKEGKISEEAKADMEKFDKEQSDFQIKSKTYNRNVSIVALISSIIIVIASLTFFKAILVIADGLLLGGVLTLLYSVIRGFGADDNMFRFVVVTVGLIVSLFLGYTKFIKPLKK